MGEQFGNAIGVDPTLNGAISSTPASGTQETWTLSATGAATTLPQKFPYMARVDNDANTPDSPFELVKVIAHPSSTTATVVRGMGGSASRAHNNGAVFKHVITAGGLQRAFGSGSAFRRAGALAETVPRAGPSFGNFAGFTTGRLHLVGLKDPLPKNEPINSIGFMSGTTGAATPTHQFFGLFDDVGNALAFTNDDLTAAWASGTEKVLSLPATFWTTYAGDYYVGIVVNATTMPNLAANTVAATGPITLAQMISGFSTTGLNSGPPALPFTAAAMSASTGVPYAWVG